MRDKKLGLNLLFLTPQLPYPPQQGTSLRNYNIIRGLAEQHQITLLSFKEGDPALDPGQIKHLLTLLQGIITIPEPPRRSISQRILQMATSREPDLTHRLRSSRFEITLRRVLSEQIFDIVQVEGIELAWTINGIRAISLNQKIVFDAHNAEAQLQKRAYQTDLQSSRRWPAAVYSRIQSGRLRDYERWACAQADWVTAVSQNDKEVLNSQMEGRSSPISVIPNSIDVNAYETQDSIREKEPGKGVPDFDIVFTGKMDYRPNVDAVLWFAEEVWPRIIDRRPQTTWAVVGQKPHARLAKLADLPGVTVTGWVAHILPYLQGSKVFIMPFRVGSGTRLKLIEAMAAGLPIVSTSLGVEGYPVVDEKDLLLAETAVDTTAAVLRLLANPDLRMELGANGRAFARNYDWRRITPLFDEVYYALVE